MIFSSLFFLFIFFPVFYCIYVCVPDNKRNLLLLVFSLVFYAWGEPVCVLLMIGSIVVNYFLGKLIGASAGSKRRAFLTAGVMLNLALLAVMKYSDMFIRGINLILTPDLKTLDIALPIGISFYTFQTISYLVDVYKNTVQPSDSIVDFGAYVSMFPQLIAGPVVRYETVSKELKCRKTDVSGISRGICRFCMGLSKKILIANEAGALFEEINALSGVQPLPLSWLGAFTYTLQIYFDFSGYSDMAIGLGLMLGFHFDENFDYPYTAKSITEFWRRWHISLSSWFKEYVYIPLGGNRRGTLRQIANIIVVWTLTGLWHGASLNFVLWGLYYCVLLLLEKLVLGRFLKKCPAFAGRIYTAVLVMVGWVIFANTDRTKMLECLQGLVGMGGTDCSYALYLLKTNWLVLAAGIVLSVGAYPALKKALRRMAARNENVYGIIRTGFVAVSLLACTAVLLRGSYNPFLYFRF